MHRQGRGEWLVVALSLLLFAGPVTGATPATPDEILAHAQLLIEHGDLSEARNLLAGAIKEFPHIAGLYNALGVVGARQGDYQAAEENFRRAIREDPHLTAAYLNLGRLHQENPGGHPEAATKALAAYREILTYDPRNVEANYQSAVLLTAQGSFKASLRHLERLPAADRLAPQALAVRCADLAGLGESAGANVAADQLLSQDGVTRADILSVLPTLEGRHADALEVRLLEGLVARPLSTPEDLYRLALAYQRGGRLAEARATLEKAAAAQPASVPILQELAGVANAQGDRKGALGYLAHARDLDPGNAAIHYFFGMICVEENLAREAYASLKKAVALEPNNPYYNYAMGAVTLQYAYASEAVPFFKKYCALKAQDPRGRFALGAAYFYSHDLQSARQEFEGVVSYPETASGGHYFLSRVATQEGNLAEAERELHQALRGNPHNADAYADLGTLRVRQKNYAEAEKALGRALEIAPDNYTANFNLMILYQRTGDPRKEAQAKRFEEVKRLRAERGRELLRTIDVRPY